MTRRRKDRTHRTFPLTLIGQLIGYKLANSRIVSKGVDLVHHISSCYNLMKKSKYDKNENCSKTDTNCPSASTRHATKADVGQSTSGPGRRHGNSNINATNAKDLGSRQSTALHQSLKATSRLTRAVAKRVVIHRKKTPTTRGHRGAHKLRSIKRCKSSKGQNAGLKKSHTSRQKGKAMRRTKLHQCRKTASNRRGDLRQGTASSDTTVPTRVTRSKDQTVSPGEPSPSNKSREDQRSANDDAKPEVVKPKVRSKTKVESPPKCQEKIRKMGTKSTTPLTRPGVSVATSPDEQEWPPLSKSMERQISGSDIGAFSNPGIVINSTSRRWADIVSRPNTGVRSSQLGVRHSALEVKSRSSHTMESIGPSPDQERESQSSIVPSPGQIRESQWSSTRRKGLPLSLLGESNNFPPTPSRDKTKKNGDKADLRCSSGKPQSTKMLRRMFGEETCRSKKEILKDKHNLKRQDLEAASCSTRHGWDKSRKTPTLSLDQDHGTSQEGGWQIDNMPEVITQPAGDEFPLRDIGGLSKTRQTRKKWKRLAQNNRLLQAPGTSKRLGSTLEGKFHLDLSEHLSSMSLRSHREMNAESSGQKKSVRKSWKRKSKSDSHPNPSGGGKKKLCCSESTNSKDNVKKGKELTENTQLRVSKKYRALLRGDHGHLDVKKVTEMAKRKTRTPERQGKPGIRRDNSHRRRLHRGTTKSDSSVLATRDKRMLVPDDDKNSDAGVRQKTVSSRSKSYCLAEEFINDNTNHPSLVKNALRPLHVQSVPDLARCSIPLCIELNATDALDLNWWHAFLQQPLHRR